MADCPLKGSLTQGKIIEEVVGSVGEEEGAACVTDGEGVSLLEVEEDAE